MGSVRALTDEIAEHRAKIAELELCREYNETHDDAADYNKEQQRAWIAFALEMEHFYLSVAEL